MDPFYVLLHPESQLLCRFGPRFCTTSRLLCLPGLFYVLL